MPATVKQTIRRSAMGVLGLTLALGLVIHLPPRLARRPRPPRGRGVPVRLRGAHTRESHRRQPAIGPRPALGFVLGQTTLADVLRWSGDHGLACEAKHGGAVVGCAAVPARALPQTTTVLDVTGAWFQFDASGALASITTSRRDHDVRAVAAAFAAARGDLTMRIGDPTTSDGSATPAVLAQGALRQAMVEFRTSGYRAVVRATNMGDGFVLTEEYRTL